MVDLPLSTLRATKHSREVAIKLIQLGSAVRGQRSRFQREISVVAKLRHPYIVSLIDSGEVDDAMYYVMPYMQGESLRDLIDREGALPLPRVVSIVRDVAEALDYAHASGIVHRDIKPQNILLSSGHAHVADFGIALARESTLSGRSTDTGIVIGTPAYMSPEQAMPGQSIDARSDVYSLGCTAYEMLTGEVPYPGRDARSVLAKHLHAPIPQLRIVRPQAPPSVQQAIEVAMAKTPADRHATANDFARALADQAVDSDANKSATLGDLLDSNKPGPSPNSTKNVTLWAAAIGILAALSGFIATRTFDKSASLRPSRADTNAYLVLSVAPNANNGLGFDAAQRLREALRYWNGIRVVDDFTMRRLFAGDTMAPSDRSVDRALAGSGSGRYIRTRVEGGPKTARLIATAFEIDGRQLAEVSDRIPNDSRIVDSVFHRVGERLLFHSFREDRTIEPRIGTTYLAARHAFLRAHQYVNEWALAPAESALFVATELDTEYFQAKLWLALVRLWREQPVARWGPEAEQVLTKGTRLTARERRMADALVALDSARFERACGTWELLANETPSDALSWYTAGVCRRRDDIVLADPTSPSGWRFRSSYRVALAHHERALRLMPAIYRGLRANGYEQLRRLLKTSGTDLRAGRAAAPDNTPFVAYPSLRDDTLAFVPIKQADLTTWAAAAVQQLSPQISRAVRRQREVFRDWATTWASNYPRSAEALEAVAISLEGLGDASALDTIARATSLAHNNDEQRRLSVTQAWMLAKFSLPANIAGLRRARGIARTLLDDALSHPDEARMLIGLAGLTGRLALAEKLASQLVTYPHPDLPADVNRAASALLLNAAIGGPSDKIQAAEGRVDSVIALSIQGTARGIVAVDILGRAAPLAFPLYRMSVLRWIEPSSTNYLFNAYKAWARADTPAVARMVETWSVTRANQNPADFTFDAQLPEAWLVASVRGTHAAAHWLDAPLSSLRFSSHLAFVDPIRAASLVRAMAFRASLAENMKDFATAKLWARAVIELWGDADPELRHIIDQMRRILD